MISLIIFLLFGGLDVAGFVLAHAYFQKIGLHFEGWIGAKMQFSSMYTLLSWIPQHFIPGLIITPLVYGELMDRNRIGKIVGYVSFTALWSIFACLGLLFFVPLSVFLSLRRKGIMKLIKDIDITFVFSITLLGLVFIFL